MSPIGFIESNGAEEEEGESKFNPTEAEMVQRLVQVRRMLQIVLEELKTSTIKHTCRLGRMPSSSANWESPRSGL